MPPQGCALAGSAFEGLEDKVDTENGVLSRASLLLGVSGLSIFTCVENDPFDLEHSVIAKAHSFPVLPERSLGR